MNERPRLLGLMGLVGLAIACFACGSSARDSFIGQYCDLLKPCCTAAGLRGDGQQCRLLFSFASSGYNAKAGDTCLAEIKAMPTEMRCAALTMDSPACSMVFPSTGTKAPGETCSSDSDCALASQGKVSCAFAFSGTTTIQKCQVQIRGQEGSSPCVGTVNGAATSFVVGATDVLSLGYLCYLDEGLRCQDGVGCVRLKAVGQTCVDQFSGECVLDARCDSTQQTCVARKQVGATCTGAQDECLATAYCKSPALTCSPKVANGAACMSSDECMSGNCDTTTATGMCKSGLEDFGLALLCGSP
jgi:hypothetical protein